MAERPANYIADLVQARARGLEAYVARMERLHVAGRLSKSDVLRVHAGAFLLFHSHAERSLEKLFIGTLLGRLEHTDVRVKPLLTVKSPVVAKRIASGGRAYADWLPYKAETVRRANSYLSGGRPFSELAKPDYEALDRLSIIRNALAHDSTAALKAFRASFVDGRPLPPDQQQPAGYLRGQQTLGQSRLSYLLAEATAVFRELTR